MEPAVARLIVEYSLLIQAEILSLSSFVFRHDGRHSFSRPEPKILDEFAALQHTADSFSFYPQGQS